MPTINGRVCVVNGKPVDKVFSNGRQVYGRNYLANSSNFSNVGIWYPHGDAVTLSVQDGCLSVFKNPSSDWPGVSEIVNLDQNDIGKNFTATTVVKNASDSTIQSMYVVLHLLGSRGQYVDRAEAYRPDLKLSSDFQTFEFNGTIPNNNQISRAEVIFLTSENKGVYHVLHKSFKFEIGDIATPWTPAPEDVGVK